VIGVLPAEGSQMTVRSTGVYRDGDGHDELRGGFVRLEDETGHNWLMVVVDSEPFTEVQQAFQTLAQAIVIAEHNAHIARMARDV
jgi:hypothetical protein